MRFRLGGLRTRLGHPSLGLIFKVDESSCRRNDLTSIKKNISDKKTKLWRHKDFKVVTSQIVFCCDVTKCIPLWLHKVYSVVTWQSAFSCDITNCILLWHHEVYSVVMYRNVNSCNAAKFILLWPHKAY